MVIEFFYIYFVGAVVFTAASWLLIRFDHLVLGGTCLFLTIVMLVLMVLTKILSLKLERAMEEDPEVRKKIKEFYEGKDFKSGKVVIRVDLGNKNRKIRKNKKR